MGNTTGTNVYRNVCRQLVRGTLLSYRKMDEDESMGRREQGLSCLKTKERDKNEVLTRREKN